MSFGFLTFFAPTGRPSVLAFVTYQSVLPVSPNPPVCLILRLDFLSLNALLRIQRHASVTEFIEIPSQQARYLISSYCNPSSPSFFSMALGVGVR